jgi:hypothetical protein
MATTLRNFPNNLNQHPQRHISVLKHNIISEQIAQANTHT